MNCRIFIDVGRFHGHPSLPALDPILGFNRIFPLSQIKRYLQIFVVESGTHALS